MTKTAFDNIVGKKENVAHQHFLAFPQWFLPYEKNYNFQPQVLLFANAADLDNPRILVYNIVFWQNIANVLC